MHCTSTSRKHNWCLSLLSFLILTLYFPYIPWPFRNGRYSSHCNYFKYNFKGNTDASKLIYSTKNANWYSWKNVIISYCFQNAITKQKLLWLMPQNMTFIRHNKNMNKEDYRSLKNPLKMFQSKGSTGYLQANWFSLFTCNLQGLCSHFLVHSWLFSPLRFEPYIL